MTARNSAARLGGMTAAVFLSVAVANSPGVAYADADEEHTSASPPAVGQSEDSTAGASEAPSTSTPEATRSHRNVVDDTDAEDPTDALDKNDGDLGEDGAAGIGDDTETTVTGDDDASTQDDATTDLDTKLSASDSKVTPARRSTGTSSPTTSFSAQTTETGSEAQNEAALSISDITVSNIGAGAADITVFNNGPESFDTASDFTSSPTGIPTGTTASQDVQLAGPAATTGVVTRVLTSLLGFIGLAPAASSTPVAPAADIGLWTVLAWVRRQFESTFLNQSPTVTYNPTQTSQTVDGVITGTLQASDPEGDPLTYTVTRQPEHGTVTINPDGTFTYTPSDGFAGPDGFTVRVTDDTGSVVHQLLRAINPGWHGDSATVGLHAVKLATIDVGGTPYGMAIDRGRTYVADGSSDEVVVIDNASTEVIARIDIGENTSPRDVVLTPDGKHLYVANFDATHVSVIDTDTNAVVAIIDVGEGANAIGISGAGDRIYVATGSGPGPGHVVVINTEDNEPIATIPVGELPSGIAAPSGHGRVYVTNRGGNSISIIDPVTNGVERTVDVGFTPIGAALSPDGQALYVVAENDNTLRILDPSDLSPIAELPVGQAPFGIGLRIGDDKATQGLVAKAFSNTVTLLRLDSPLGVLGQIEVGGQQPVDVVVSPDGTTAFVSNFDSGTVSVIGLGEPAAPSAPAPRFGAFGVLSWFAEQVYHTLFNHAPVVNDIAAQHIQNADGTITGAFDVVDRENDEVTFTVTRPPEHGTVVVNADGTYTYTPNADYRGPDTFTVRVTDTTPSLVHALLRVVNPSFHTTSATAHVITARVDTIDIGGAPYSIVMTDPFGEFAYVTNGAAGFDVAVINTEINAVVDHIDVGSLSGGAVVSPNSEHVYVAELFGTRVAVIDTQLQVVVAHIDIGTNTFDLAISPDGSRLYATKLTTGEVAVIDTSTHSVIDTVAVGDTPTGVAISPDGDWVYVANTFSGSVSVIDTNTNTVTHTIAVGAEPAELVVEPNGRRAYVANRESNTVSVIDTDTHTVIHTIAVGDRPVGMAISHDGRQVYVTNEHNSDVSVIDTATNTVLTTIRVGRGPTGAAATPNGDFLYVANQTDGTVSVIDLRDIREASPQLA